MNKKDLKHFMYEKEITVLPYPIGLFIFNRNASARKRKDSKI